VVFQRRMPPAAPQHHAPVRAAAEVYEPMYHG
jgi:hypothetical protein